jgi:hypothetical protein
MVPVKRFVDSCIDDGDGAVGMKLAATVKADAAEKGRSCDARCITKPAPSHASALSSRAIYVILGNLARQAQEQHSDQRSGLAEGEVWSTMQIVTTS